MKSKPKYQICTVCRTVPWFDVMHDNCRMPRRQMASDCITVRAVVEPGDSALMWLLLQYTSPSRAAWPELMSYPARNTISGPSSFGKLDSKPHRPCPCLAYENRLDTEPAHYTLIFKFSYGRSHVQFSNSSNAES